MKTWQQSLTAAALAVAAVATSSVANAAPVTATATGNVSRVWQYVDTALNGNTYINLAGISCTPTNGNGTNYYIIDGDAAHQDTLVSLLMASQLSGRNVVIGYDTANCKISSVQLR